MVDVMGCRVTCRGQAVSYISPAPGPRHLEGPLHAMDTFLDQVSSSWSTLAI